MISFMSLIAAPDNRAAQSVPPVQATIPATPVERVSIRSRFDAALSELRGDLLAMGFETEAMLHDAIASLLNQDTHQAEQIRLRDDKVDALEARIEAGCLRVFATQQPVLASDLRLVSTILKVATDVERIGDHTVNIARAGQRMLKDGALYRPMVDIPRLGEMTGVMLHDALESLVHQDAARARQVIAADDAVDERYARMRRDLQAAMQADPQTVIAGSGLLFVIHYLERISDHATNIAERVLFLDGRE